MASHLLFSLPVNHLAPASVDILSIYKNKLIVSCFGYSRIFIYNHKGSHLSTVITNNNDWLLDAAWTPRGNIVYTTSRVNKVVVVAESGKLITTCTQITEPRYLSVANDGIMYLANFNTGVYQSTDDGMNWSLVFKSTDGWHSWQVIKVTTDNNDDFWTLEVDNNKKYHLRVYSADTSNVNSSVKWRDIQVIPKNGKLKSFESSIMTHDGNMNVFISFRYTDGVYVLSINGSYQCQLISSNDIQNKPFRLAVDYEGQLLYVGQKKSVVEVFNLTYGVGVA